nr:unnamed protein product [Callosobruchus analis]
MGGKIEKTTSSCTPPLSPKRRRRHSKRRSPSTPSSSSSESSDGEARKRIIRLEKRISKLQAQVGTSSILPISSISTGITETVIPLFDPGLNIITAEEWIRRVDELKLYHKWDDLTTAKLATSRLRGNAWRWYDGSQITLNSWELLKSLLILNFPSTIRFGKSLLDAATCTPQPKQNLGDYCFEKVARLNKLHLSIPEEYLIDSVIEEIGDNTVAMSAHAANFKTVGELASYLSNIGILRPNKVDSQRVATVRYPTASTSTTGGDTQWRRQHGDQQNIDSRKLENCVSFKTQIDYLGREVSAAGIRPGRAKIAAVIKMKSPRNVKEI